MTAEGTGVGWSPPSRIELGCWAREDTIARMNERTMNVPPAVQEARVRKVVA
jgi:hypothetical protein